jgi:hypothetical protein
MAVEDSVRARRAQRDAEDRAARWRYERAVARIEVVHAVLADYATSCCGRPLRRRDVGPMESAVDLPGVIWTIEGDVMVEYLYNDAGPGRLVVHELALLEEIRGNLRSRHVTIEYRERW